MTESHNDLLDTILKNLQDRGDDWDQPPCLLFVEESEGKWHLTPFGIPSFVWQGEPGAALERVARFVDFFGGKGIVTPPSQGWRGYAFFAESWLVEQEGPLDPVLDEMARAHMLSQHPGRVECRSLWAATSDGWFFSASIDRNGKVRVAQASAPGDDNFREGRIPTALETLVRVADAASQKTSPSA